ncbi:MULTISPECIES: YjbH domain-containing protein [Roseobacteraceae]|uniref:Exopolysaccharide biosynthesis protein YbjH n=1 Tax=Pseudosulfitobacter pseudonitzschiae TaxID=1402135 RepID=A0A221K6M4_9RHOB|nr:MULTISPECIES: YjbH domain-containing protein [Roseobacteraceae]ASM74648.1 exopolysaccharide biosynthesis protein YbjH [Pseudosulfitobacter pseudonitzschiae]
MRDVQMFGSRNLHVVRSVVVYGAVWVMLLSAAAQAQVNYSYNTYGNPGLIDMPTAQSAEDAELAGTVSHFAGSTRNTLTFQFTPRLSGSFRYSKIENHSGNPSSGALFDRSFDLRYRIWDETRYRPAVAIGLRDLVGTGVYSSEYIVATKTVAPRLTLTGGLGWGRLGSYNGFTNPLGALDKRFETRPSGFTGTGGQVESAKWFRGDAAFFGGVSWAATDKLSLKAEYSSDAYTRIVDNGAFDRKSPFNFGINYKLRDNVHMQVHYLYGSELGISFNLISNPRKPAVYGGTGAAPLPVKRRSGPADLGWFQEPETHKTLRNQTASLLAADGMTLEAMKLNGTQVTVHIRNDRYIASPEAIGRTARILTQTLPASVETFTIIPVENGMPLSATTLTRSDMEDLENAPDATWRSYARAQVTDAAGSLAGVTYNGALYPKFSWSLGPYISTSYFDPQEPVRVDAGLKLQANYDIAPGWVVSGTLQHRIVGNVGDSTRPSDSKIQKVRSEGFIYAREGKTALTNLTLAHYFRPGKDLYGRVTFGYLEREYGGLSGEILWKPVDSRLALGAEVNVVKQRDFDQGFGFRDYSSVTGHLSTYYDFGNGYHGQIDAGRYLAGDYGVTFSFDRTFANGWSVGAYATLTDVSFDDFGEGSFDKGIRITVPLEHFLGKPVRQTYKTVLQPLTRDGGARLNVDGRLYDSVRSYHNPQLKDSWGRFWR